MHHLLNKAAHSSINQQQSILLTFLAYTLSVKRNLSLLQGDASLKIHAIKINNVWTQISFNTPLIRISEKTQDFLPSKRSKMRLNHERSFFENHRNCSPSEHWASSTEAAYSEHSIAIHSISMAGYVNAVRAIVCFKLPAREASSFCDFWKLTSCDFIAFIPSLIEVNFCFF